MDHLSNFVAIINNAVKQKNVSATVRNTKLVRNCLHKLIQLGFVRAFTIISPYKIIVYINFDKDNNTVLKNIRRVSRPGQRVYTSYCFLTNTGTKINATGATLLLSTSKGIYSASESSYYKLGGEIILSIV